MRRPARRGQGLQVRPLAFSVPFEVSVVLPQLRVENPLRADFLVALQAAARDMGVALKGKPGRPASRPGAGCAAA